MLNPLAIKKWEIDKSGYTHPFLRQKWVLENPARAQSIGDPQMTQNPILTPGRHSQGPYTARASIFFHFQAHIWPQHRRRAQGLTRVPTCVRHLGGYTQRHLLFFSCTHLCPFFDPLLSKLYPLLSTYGQRKPSGNRPPRHRTAEHRIASERLRTLSEPPNTVSMASFVSMAGNCGPTAEEHLAR